MVLRKHEKEKLTEANIFRRGQFFEIGDLSYEEHSVFTSKYMGAIMYTGKELTLGVCLSNNEEFIYEKGENIAVAYIHRNELYVCKARINDISEAQESEIMDLMPYISSRTFKEQADKFFGNQVMERLYIVRASVLTQAKKHQRRQHFRILADWNIHFRLLNTGDELSFMEQKWLAEKMFDFHHGYFRMKTADISGGGFKSLAKHAIPEGTEIECIVEVTDGAHGKSHARSKHITGKIINCTPNRKNPEFFDIRVQFVDIPGQEMDFIVKNIMMFESRQRSLKAK